MRARQYAAIDALFSGRMINYNIEVNPSPFVIVRGDVKLLVNQTEVRLADDAGVEP